MEVWRLPVSSTCSLNCICAKPCSVANVQSWHPGSSESRTARLRPSGGILWTNGRGCGLPLEKGEPDRSGFEARTLLCLSFLLPLHLVLLFTNRWLTEAGVGAPRGEVFPVRSQPDPSLTVLSPSSVIQDPCQCL